MTQEDDLLAAEVALGLLDADETAAAQQRARGDVALFLRIEWWREQFAPLVDEIASEPPASVWPAIERRLAANDNPATPSRFWRNWALAVSSIAAVLVGYIGTRPTPAPVTVTKTAPAPLIAVLSGTTGTQVALRIDPAREQVRVIPGVLNAGRGDAELWVIPADGKPRSLGVVPASATSQRAIPDPLRGYVNNNSVFAVSLEPKGGSPTGPVVATGKLLPV